MEPTYFRTAAEYRRWLAKHHATATELLLGFWKVGAGTIGITYAEALDESLCHGWIDGVRRRVDDERFTIRFTPRKPRSIWSQVNLKRAAALLADGRMAAAGKAAFEGRDLTRQNLYSFENRPQSLSPAFAKRMKADAAANAFWKAQPPGYRRVATWWVVSAKKVETRERRFAALLRDSAAQHRIRAISSPTRKST